MTMAAPAREEGCMMDRLAGPAVQGEIGSQASGAAVAPRLSPWIIGIILGFAVVVLVNAGFIYAAVKGADKVVPSYHTEGR
jgi:hypothetical protein